MSIFTPITLQSKDFSIYGNFTAIEKVFLKEKSLIQAVEDKDRELVSKLLEEGVNPNILRYPDSLIEPFRVSKLPLLRSQGGAFIKSMRDLEFDWYDLFAPYVDFKQDGLQFVLSATQLGNVKMLQKILNHPDIKSCPPLFFSKNKSPLAQNDPQRMWKSISEASMAHYGTEENVHISNEIFEIIFNHFKAHDALYYFMGKIHYFNSKIDKTLTDEMSKTIWSKTHCSAIYLTHFSHGEFSACTQLLKEHPIHLHQDEGELDSHDKAACLIGAFKNHPEKRKEWIESMGGLLSLQDTRYKNETLCFIGQMFDAAFTSNVMTQTSLFSPSELKEFISKVEPYIDLEQLICGVIDLKKQGINSHRMKLLKTPLSFWSAAHLDALSEFLSHSQCNQLIEEWGKDADKDFPMVLVKLNRFKLDESTPASTSSARPARI